MSTRGPKPKVSDAELCKAIKERNIPFATAGDIADVVDLSRFQTSKRLDKLAESGQINRGVVGERVKIYWLSD